MPQHFLQLHGLRVLRFEDDLRSELRCTLLEKPGQQVKVQALTISDLENFVDHELQTLGYLAYQIFDLKVRPPSLSTLFGDST